MKRFLLGICLFSAVAAAQPPKGPQISWYKFSKVFISEHYSKDSAIGELEASAIFPNKDVHRISCGGKDGELHMGVAEKAIQWSHPKGIPFSAAANDDSKFGIVAAPVNLTDGTDTAAHDLKVKGATFTGYSAFGMRGMTVGK